MISPVTIDSFENSIFLKRHEDTKEHKVVFTKLLKQLICVPPCLRAVVQFFIPESPPFNVNIQLASYIKAIRKLVPINISPDRLIAKELIKSWYFNPWKPYAKVN